MWNPIKHIKEAWGGATTIWGKISVAVFYGFLWLFVATNIAQLVVPFSQGYDCITKAETDAAAVAWIEGFLRSRTLVCIYLALYVENTGHTLWNMFTFLAMMGGAYLLTFLTSMPSVKAAGGESGECLEGMMRASWIYLTPVAVAWLCLVLEKRTRPSGTSGETAPLV